MIRDISSITRDLEKKHNNDIIFKKYMIEKMFKEDPDILELLGKPEKRPLNKYIDKDNPTEEELVKRQEILDYNEKIEHEQIVPFLKLNGVQKEVLNFIMFDIDDNGTSYSNKAIKNQYLIIYIVIHENDMYTEYGVTRADLIDYAIRDLLCWSNVLGKQMKLQEDTPMIMDTNYYIRRMKFYIEMPNVVNNHMGMNNIHDRWQS